MPTIDHRRTCIYGALRAPTRCGHDDALRQRTATSPVGRRIFVLRGFGSRRANGAPTRIGTDSVIYSMHLLVNENHRILHLSAIY